jgi:hypothetical protein
MGFRSGGGVFSGVAAEEIPTPPPPPTEPSGAPDIEPYIDPPPKEEMDMTSALRTRLRYAR